MFDYSNILRHRSFREEMRLTIGGNFVSTHTCVSSCVRCGMVTCMLDFESMRGPALKALLQSRDVSIDGCFDKQALIERAEAYRALMETPVAPAWDGGEPVEQGPSADASASLLLLHGFGDSGSGFISSMGGPLVAMDGLRVVFPSAPRVSLGGYAVSSWLDAPVGGAMAAPQAMMRAGDDVVQRAVQYVHSLIRREVGGRHSNSRTGSTCACSLRVELAGCTWSACRSDRGGRVLTGRADCDSRRSQLPGRPAGRVSSAFDILWRRKGDCRFCQRAITTVGGAWVGRCSRAPGRGPPYRTMCPCCRSVCRGEAEAV